MGQKLLLLIFIVLLFNVTSRAETDGSFPKLSVGSTIESTDKPVDLEISTWQKIKAFFGFGEGAIVENNQADNEQNIDSADSSSAVEDSMDAELTDKSLDIPLIPEKNFEEAPMPTKEIKTESKELEVSSEGEEKASVASNKDNSNETDLALPTGFDDTEELKLPSGFSKDDVESSADNSPDIPNQMELTTKSDKIPTLHSEQTAEIVDDVNRNIAIVDDLELPSGFDDVNPVDTQLLELPKTDDDQDAIKSEENKDKVVLPEEDSEKNLEEDSEKNISQTEQKENNVLPIPDYALTPNPSQEQETSVSKLTKAFENEKANKIELPKITENDFVENDEGKAIKQESVELDSAQLLFVNNETKVLILPNDGVVLGEVSKKDKIDDLDLNSYIDIFWSNYYRLERAHKKDEIELFIDSYDENFNEEDFVYLDGVAGQALKQAFEAIDKGDIITLSALINSYHIINLPDGRNNTLLHRAAYRGNYSAVKLLLMKGVELNARNSKNENALKISRKFRHKNVTNLLVSAGLK
jgi:hypothetical protein